MRFLPLALFALIGVQHPAAASGPPLLLQKPALSQRYIVFAYAGDLWRVARDGGDAVRLTTGAGIETDPVFSPDGQLVVFSGAYDGNTDVYSVAVEGGVPKRLTWHPLPDVPLGFSPDGKSVLFRSARLGPIPYNRLFTLPLEGGFPTEIPLPMAEGGAYSPDGSRLAYMPVAPAFNIWKHYRGGRTTPIWIANLADSSVEKIPRENSNDFNPIWVGGQVYFLSDRNGAATLFAYDVKSKKVTQLIENSGLDYKSASAGPGALVLEQFGSIQLFDFKTHNVKPVEIRIQGDMPSVRPYFDKVARRIDWADLSPTGMRAVFGARGEVLTVPAEKGDIRNLTGTSGVAERYPTWSPNGQQIAYFSDESGEYQLHIRAQNGMGELKKYDVGGPAFFYDPRWSPDGKKIVFRDSQLTVKLFDIESRKVTRVDADFYDTPFRQDLNPTWSPDSKYIVYTKILRNHLRAVFVYSLETGTCSQLSDGMSDARYAAFDKNGRYVYFTASTNVGLSTGWLDMSSIDRVTNRSVYLIVLRKEDPSPLAPESDEEKPEPDKKEEPKKDDAQKENNVRIDLDGISQRILALPIPARNFSDLQTGRTGVLYLLEDPPVGAPDSGPSVATLHKFDLKTRKFDKVLDGLRGFTISFNGEKMLYRQGDRWAIAATGAPPKAGEGNLNLDGMEVRVEPALEWQQIYREVWRIERDFFYDPGYHGLDIKSAEQRYGAYLTGVTHRADLNYLMAEMLGQFSVGHMGVRGGALPEVKSVPVGLLGADYKIENGRYRFDRVYNGENWNPELRAPLTQPGVNVIAGECLLTVNGRDVRSTDNVYSYFEGTAGKSVLLRVGPNPNGDGSREVTVVPVAEERALRYLAWIESNRRKVETLSQGRLGYLHLPNTSNEGYTNFNRYFFAQVGKDGLVLDERFNGGGYIADYIIDYLRRPLTNFFSTRAGQDFTTPMDAIFGPKAMIINEYAGSGGDAMPWLFHKLGIGPLVGKRTWGGLVGIFGFPQLVDGGSVTAPNLAFYNLNQDWDVENHGVQPDVEVDFDPAQWRQGRDPQLEKAVEIVMDALKKAPPPVYKKPAYPNYHKETGLGTK
jgi:tricorn protease